MPGKTVAAVVLLVALALPASLAPSAPSDAARQAATVSPEACPMTFPPLPQNDAGSGCDAPD